MQTITSRCFGIISLLLTVLGACAHQPATVPLVKLNVKVIFDTDMALDVDDVGALAMLHKMADAGECEILGVVVSESVHNYDGQWTPPLVDVLNTYYGRPDIPVGVFKGPHQDTGAVGHYAEKVVKAGFPHDLKTGSDAEDGVRLYRRLLATQPDASVTVITVGYLTNLDGLLQSQPDDVSPMTGRELIQRKVKLWSCMGGGYPTSGQGGEFNLRTYGNASERVINNWPGRAVFGGAELGSKYFVGGQLQQLPGANRNPVALSWLHFNGGKKRESWDELSVLYGVRGAAWGGTTYFALVQSGSNHYEMIGKTWPGSPGETSQNTWVATPVKNQAYLVPSASIADVEATINQMLMAPPGAAHR